MKSAERFFVFCLFYFFEPEESKGEGEGDIKRHRKGNSAPPLSPPLLSFASIIERERDGEEEGTVEGENEGKTKKKKENREREREKERKRKKRREEMTCFFLY